LAQELKHLFRTNWHISQSTQTTIAALTTNSNKWQYLSVRNSRKTTHKQYYTKICRSTHREQNHTSITPKHKQSKLPYRGNQEVSNHSWEKQLNNKIYLDKSHVGIYGNELAEKLAKAASRIDDVSFKSIPKIVIMHQNWEQSIAKWENQRDRTTQGQVTRQFFPIIKDRRTKK